MTMHFMNVRILCHSFQNYWDVEHKTLSMRIVGQIKSNNSSFNKIRVLKNYLMFKLVELSVN
jgi:hypothetical protein